MMKWFQDMLQKMDKTRWLILGLSGILLLIIALPTDGIQGTKEEEIFGGQESTGIEEDISKQYARKLASQLEQALACMDGVGKVHVMITLKDSGEAVVEKDVTESGNGQSSSQYQEATVFTESGGREPYVSQQKLPAVEGVFVAAQGGGDSGVKQDIKEAVMALFPVEAHKIKIVKMQMQKDGG